MIASIPNPRITSKAPSNKFDFTISYMPINEMRRRGVYFMNQPIQSYLHENEVKMTSQNNMVLFGGYSYLSINNHPHINRAVEEGMKKYGTGTSGSRLLTGTLDVHAMLEAKIAEFKGTEDSVTFTSGFTANISTITALVGKGDTILSDKLNHASINDGCSMSGANIKRFRHNDMPHLERLLKSVNGGKILVVADGVFSMDGDIVDLPEMARLCKKYGALLMIDEAHSTGMLGKTGRGVEEYFGLPKDTIDIKMGTLSKAIPSQGGYVAASSKICDFLRHHAKGFMYSGAISPLQAIAAKAGIEVIEQNPHLVKKLDDNTIYFKEGLKKLGFSYHTSETAIVPIICEDKWKVFELAHYCQQNGYYIQAVPEPVVPKGLSRLRVSINAGHTIKEMDGFLNTLERGAWEIGGIL